MISQFREPVDRFLSAYEFAVEVSARELGRKKPLKESVEGDRINTRDVWPWMYLVPFFDMDLNYGVSGNMPLLHDICATVKAGQEKNKKNRDPTLNGFAVLRV